jgi:predicted transcriptional regulator
MKDKFAHSLSSKWSIGVLDFVFTQPYFRSNRLAQKLGVSSASAMRFIRILHEQGLIQVVEEPAGRKSGLYKFEPLLNLVRT